MEGHCERTCIRDRRYGEEFDYLTLIKEHDLSYLWLTANLYKGKWVISTCYICPRHLPVISLVKLAGIDVQE